MTIKNEQSSNTDCIFINTHLHNLAHCSNLEDQQHVLIGRVYWWSVSSEDEDDDSEDRVLSLNCFDACFTVLTKVAN